MAPIKRWTPGNLARSFSSSRIIPAPATSAVGGVTTANLNLALRLRALSYTATTVMLISVGSSFVVFYHHEHWRFWKAMCWAVVLSLLWRGIVEVGIRRTIPWPSLFGSSDPRIREEEITNRRRAWSWARFYHWVGVYWTLCTTIFVLYLIFHHEPHFESYWSTIATFPVHITHYIPLATFLELPFLFGANFLIFLGPLLMMGISQMKIYEPGDANWGVKLDDVRGQKDAKEDIRRIVTLWQSGDIFEQAGGKRERGLLFLGAPGTGKTMMAKAIATGFNSPILTMPGSGFAQTFIGLDSVIVRIMAARAKKLARKWGGQCLIFIDEIDAVGMRRRALNPQNDQEADPFATRYFGRMGAVNESGDIIVETETWREWLFRERAPETPEHYPQPYRWLGRIIRQGIFPGMGGMGSMALNTLLVVMDGIDGPGFWAKFWKKRANVILDMVFIVPVRVRRPFGYMIGITLSAAAAFFLVMDVWRIAVGMPIFGSFTTAFTMANVLIALILVALLRAGREITKQARLTGTSNLRLPPSKPHANQQIYFIGATNVPVEALDPALIRAGRLGRHVTFRTPTKEDRKDIFDLYLGKVAHDPELDTPERRDELARITSGYSPAMIDQICSLALTNAQFEGRLAFLWEDLVSAMTVVEAGTAVDIEWDEEDDRATAIHEAGHAVAAHVYRPEVESSRLSIRMRGFARGHHQSFDKDERYGRFQSRVFAQLIHFVGAMAAELVFYGENSTGVGGDMGATTAIATQMTGAAGMSPTPLDLKGKTMPGKTEEETREAINRRLEDLGGRLVNRSSAGWQALADRRKAAYTTRFVGQALVIAYQLMVVNRAKVEAIADAVVKTKEIFGDELVRLLDAQDLVKPEIDWTDEAIWPPIVDYTPDPRRGRNGDGPGDMDVGAPADGGAGGDGGGWSSVSGNDGAAERGDLVHF